MVYKNKRSWNERLFEALWAFQTTFGTSTRATPYALVFGSEAVLPLEVQIPSLRIAIQESLTNEESVQIRLAELEIPMRKKAYCSAESRDISTMHGKCLQQKRGSSKSAIIFSNDSSWSDNVLRPKFGKFHTLFEKRGNSYFGSTSSKGIMQLLRRIKVPQPILWKLCALQTFYSSHSPFLNPCGLHARGVKGILRFTRIEEVYFKPQRASHTDDEQTLTYLEKARLSDDPCWTGVGHHYKQEKACLWLIVHVEHMSYDSASQSIHRGTERELVLAASQLMKDEDACCSNSARVVESVTVETTLPDTMSADEKEDILEKAHSALLLCLADNVLRKIRMHDSIVRTLSDVRHIPELRKNLISLGTLNSNSCSYRAVGGVMRIMKGALVVMKGLKQNGLYLLQGSTVTGAAEIASSSDIDSDTTKLWHMRLGHMSERGMDMLSKQGLLGSKKIGKLDFL
ncbi:hypothetical protein RJ639_011020 [Escallonia herrerae]|uniref:GAG-pre-integrase domain-containing protein n=1 Tax=Escallonia herrerae TaxID=1293975 RepID=A0AA88VNI6_9ASTE|nr:hypothetical protein RJ639_011020 [Escallonia herrerae]